MSDEVQEGKYWRKVRIGHSIWCIELYFKFQNGSYARIVLETANKALYKTAIML